jgi:TRAP transporter TAXI family solute receptor
VREFARRRGGKVRLSIATGNVGGVYYVYGGALAGVISRHVPNVEATAEATAASVDNLKFLHRGTTDLALTVAPTLDEAVRGAGPFAATGRVPVRTIAALYPQYTQLITLAGSGIHTLADLRGRVVSTGPPGSGTEGIALAILEAAGIDARRGIRRQALSLGAAMDALRDAKLDAAFWSSGVPAGAVVELAASPGVRVRLVPLDETLPALRRRHGRRRDGSALHYAGSIARAAYPWLGADVPTVAVTSLLVADERLAEPLAYEITRAMFEHREELVAVHPEARHLEPAFAARNSPAPHHPGAIRWYRERGAWPG